MKEEITSLNQAMNKFQKDQDNEKIKDLETEWDRTTRYVPGEQVKFKLQIEILKELQHIRTTLEKNL